MSVCLSVGPHGTTRLPLVGFEYNFIFEDFLISAQKIKVSLKYDNNNRTLHEA